MENQKIETIRHSLSHILAYAVQELYPVAPTKSGRASPSGRGTKFGIGPAIENGFYYDFLFKNPITPDDLPKIEGKMRELVKKGFDFKKKEISKKEAEKLFKDQPYKLELIADLPEGKITIYKSGDFTDLCAGPHIKSAKDLPIDGFKLNEIAGAYWKGSEKNQMLTRIYGLAFESKKELEDYIKLREEAEKRDHRIIGKELDLFVFSDLVGKGLPLFTEKGSIIRRILERFIVDEEIKRGYKHVYTPDIARVELYKTSGHYPYYKESMYPVMKIDEEEFILRPMTCPHHFQLYASRPHTYKELPYRIAELAKQFRYEKSGELIGLTRVRTFCLADSHIICQKDQAEEEIGKALDLIEHIAYIFNLKIGIDYRYRLSLGSRADDKKYYKDDKSWNFAENVLKIVLKKRGAPFFEAGNEAAFYGPKIDIQMKNFSGKEDTAFTVQYDFVMPKKFNLFYIDKDGTKKEPIVIHRSSIGCIERIMAFLIEKYAGAFPFWLAPVQIRIIPISDKHIEYAEKVKKELGDFRVEVDAENETMGKKIRNGELQKIPYLLVVGDKEVAANSVAVRQRKNKEIKTMRLNEFIENIKKEVENKN